MVKIRSTYGIATFAVLALFFASFPCVTTAGENGREPGNGPESPNEGGARAYAYERRGQSTGEAKL